jgi:hypothetical protein
VLGNSRSNWISSKKFSYEIEKNNDSNVANDDTDDARTELSELL